jgi:hypothetical protein
LRTSRIKEGERAPQFLSASASGTSRSIEAFELGENGPVIGLARGGQNRHTVANRDFDGLGQKIRRQAAVRSDDDWGRWPILSLRFEDRLAIFLDVPAL